MEALYTFTAANYTPFNKRVYTQLLYVFVPSLIVIGLYCNSGGRSPFLYSGVALFAGFMGWVIYKSNRIYLTSIIMRNGKIRITYMDGNKEKVVEDVVGKFRFHRENEMNRGIQIPWLTIAYNHKRLISQRLDNKDWEVDDIDDAVRCYWEMYNTTEDNE